MASNNGRSGACPLGRLPKGWTLAQLHEITTKIGTGATPRGGEKVYLSERERFALIRSQHVYDRNFDANGLAFISNGHANGLRNAEVQRDDLLLNITGDGITFGRACRVDPRVLPACVNQHVSIIRVDPQVAAPGYILAYLTHPFIKQYIESFNAGGSRRAITKGHIESFEIPLPPLDEQRRIAAILGAFDDKIELNRRMNETLEAMARALFKSWFIDFDPVYAKAAGRHPSGLDSATAKLFPDNCANSRLGKVPSGWRVSPLPDAFDVNPPRQLTKGAVAPYLEMANMPTTSARAVTWVNREFTSGMRFRNGDTLVARITPCLENGKTAFVDFLSDKQVGWGSTEYIVLCAKPPLPAAFGYFLARTDEFRSHVIANMTGTSGRQRAPAECLNKFLIVVPPASIAGRFGELASATLATMKANDEQSANLATARDALLPKLLAGDLTTRGELV